MTVITDSVQTIPMRTPETRSAPWPAEARALFERALTCEYATLTGKGSPLTYPVNPYLGEDGRTLDVSTGLTYPGKAERARRNPKVALLFSDPVGSGLADPPVVLVQGLAAVRDADLQANTDRYMRLSFQKLPEAYAGMPPFMLRRLQWYFTRIWVLVTPLRMWLWPQGDLSRMPERWEAPDGLPVAESDPPPPGKSPGTWNAGQADWRAGAVHAVRNLGEPVLTVVDETGFPLPLRLRCIQMIREGFHFILPAGVTQLTAGPACLTFHSHPERFTGQENIVFSGSVEPDGTFAVRRQLGDVSLAGGKVRSMLSFMRTGRKLAPRLRQEAARRSQPVPVIHVPSLSKASFSADLRQSGE